METMHALQVEQIRKPMVLRAIPVAEIGEDDALVRVTWGASSIGAVNRVKGDRHRAEVPVSSMVILMPSEIQATIIKKSQNSR